MIKDIQKASNKNQILEKKNLTTIIFLFLSKTTDQNNTNNT
jgi:hypothetical protein